MSVKSIEDDHVSCRGIVFPDNRDILTRKIKRKLTSETYESPEANSLHRFLKPTARVLELGGGIGFISSLMSRVGIDQVTTIEANPVLCDYIGQVHAANGVKNAEVLNGVALTDHAAAQHQEMSFYVTDPFWSSSLQKPQARDAEEIKVPTYALSEVIKSRRANTIVCDIEGGELDLFKDTDLTGIRHVYMELHTRRYGGRGVISIFEAMHAHGFYYHQKISGHDVCLFERLRKRD